MSCSLTNELLEESGNGLKSPSGRDVVEIRDPVNYNYVIWYLVPRLRGDVVWIPDIPAPVDCGMTDLAARAQYNEYFSTLVRSMFFGPVFASALDEDGE